MRSISTSVDEAPVGWPLLADLQSQIRFDNRNLIHMDLALQNSGFVTELARAELAAYGLPFDPSRAAERVPVELLLDAQGEVVALRLVEPK